MLQAQSRAEIYVDKLLAFALRSNQLKYRDLWDIVWLHQQGLKPNFKLIPLKLRDRKLTQAHFFELFNQHLNHLSGDDNLKVEFKQEMQRFLPLKQINNTIEQNGLWSFIVYLMADLGKEICKHLISK